MVDFDAPSANDCVKGSAHLALKFFWLASNNILITENLAKRGCNGISMSTYVLCHVAIEDGGSLAPSLLF